MAGETEKKWFLRCCGCLSVMATVADRPASGLKCAACSSHIEVMGVVHQSRLVRFEDRTPCDDRCCFASGPECNCQCGGKNHGSKITVQVVVDLGGIPRVKPQNVGKALRVFGEYTKARAATLDHILRHFPKAEAYSRGDTEGLSQWELTQGQRGYRYLMQLAAVERLKTHHGRIKALEKIQAHITEAAR